MLVSGPRRRSSVVFSGVLASVSAGRPTQASTPAVSMWGTPKDEYVGPLNNCGNVAGSALLARGIHNWGVNRFQSVALTTTVAPTTTATPTTTVAPPTTATPTTTAKVLAGLGEEVRDGKFAFVVTAIDNPGNVYDPEGLLADEAVGTWLLVHVTVTNIGDRQWSFSSGDQRLLWDDKTFSAEGFAWNGTSFENLNPGLTLEAIVLFHVPEGFPQAGIGAVLELHDSAFSGGIEVYL